MPRKPPAPKPLSTAERQARHRGRKAAAEAKMRAALERVQAAKTVQEARAIAAAALQPQ